jgi:hypothetical protein
MTDSERDSAWLTDALRASSEDARPRDDCPAPDRIWAAVQLELPLEERLAIIDHLASCQVCAEAWRLSMELAAEGTTVKPDDRTPAPFNRAAILTTAKSRPAWAAIAASLGVIAGLVFVLRSSLTDEPVLRAPANGAIESLVGERGQIPRDDFRLEWSAGPPGARYDLTMTTSDLEVIVDVRGLDRTEYRIAPERLADVPPGARVLWRVFARTPDGATVSSRTFETTVP